MNSLTKVLLEDLLDADNKKVTAIYGGGFKPPTKGHFDVVAKASEQNPEIDDILIYVGGGERDGISQGESIQIWELYKKYLPIKTIIEPVNAPVGSILRYAKEHPEETVLWMIGARENNPEDFADIASRTRTLEKYPNLQLRVIQTSGGVSGTAARNAVKDNNKEQFFHLIPDIPEKEQVWDIISPVVKEEKITEVGEANLSPYKWEEVDKNGWVTFIEFTTESETKYSVNLTTVEIVDPEGGNMNLEAIDIEFSAKPKGAEGSSSKIVVNKGEIYRVMSTLTDIIKHYVKKIEAKAIIYSPSKKSDEEDFGTQRDNLYKAFISKSIPGAKFTNSKNNIIAILPNTVNEIVTDTKVICDNCDWEWKIADGGDDLYICHKCGHDNNPDLEEGTCGYDTDVKTGKKLDTPGGLEEAIEGEKDLAPFDFEQDGNESRISRDINNKKGWRRLSSDLSQNSSIKKYLDKYTSGYKWSNPPNSKRFPKENDIMYKTPYIMYVHLLQTSEGKNNIIDALNGMVVNEPDNVMKQVLQALLLVFTGKEDQFKKVYEQYKNMIENNAKSDDGTNPFSALKYAYKNFSDKEGIFKKFKRNGWSSQQFMIKEDLQEGRPKKKDPKKGTGKKPEGSSRRLYTDEDPKDTVSIKFKTKEDIVDTLNKKQFKAKSHARQSQVINLIHQRVRAAYSKSKDPEVRSRLKRALDYIEKRKEMSKKKTERLRKLKESFELQEKINPSTKLKSNIINEGRYDSISRQLASYTLKGWKDDFEHNEPTGRVEFTVGPDGDLEYEDLKFSYKGVAIFAGIQTYSYNGSARLTSGEIKITYSIPNSMLPQGWEKIYMDLISVIRHEIEHLTQGGINVKPGKEILDLPLRRLVIKYPDTLRYILLPSEKDANVQGLYLKAKKSRRPYAEVVDEYIRDVLKITNKNDVDILKGMYDKRAKELNLPAILENDPFGLNKLSRQFIKEALIETWNPKESFVSLSKYMIDNGMNIKPLPKIKIISNDEENASNLLGKTAYYNPNDKSITLYTKDRHPKDICRSFTHEMVHHEQNLEGRLNNINTTNTNEDGALPEIEREAYEKGNMMLRNWEDSIKNV